MSINQSHQFECYSLESPVSCSILSINKLSKNCLQKTISKCSYSKSLEITLWDNQHKMQNYILELDQQKEETSKSIQHNIVRKGDIKNHKFGIKKAYSCGNYFIILDEDKIVTVRKQWQIQQCFTDIQEIVLYELSSIQNVQIQKVKCEYKKNEQNKLFNQNKGINQICNLSIFILNQVKQKKQDTNKSQGSILQTQLIVIWIKTSNIQQKNNNNDDQQIQYKIVKLNKNRKLGFSGKWVYSQNLIYNIKITNNMRNNINMKVSGQDEIKIQVIPINMKFMINRTNHSIQQLYQFQQISHQIFFIIYLNQLKQLCNCKFQYLSETNNNILNFNHGLKINKLFNHTNIQNIYKSIFSSSNLIKIAFPSNKLYSISKTFNNNQFQLINIMLLLNKNYIFIYQTHSLQFIYQISLPIILNQQISPNCIIAFLNQFNIWIFDQSNISIHKINLQTIFKEQIIKPLNSLFNPESQQLMKSHSNTIKLLNLRLKVLKVLQSYLQGKNNELTLDNNATHKSIQSSKIMSKQPDFSSCLRLLNREENISIINDGISYLINFMVTHFQNCKLLENILPSTLNQKNLQENLVKLLNKLILSKYESHVEKGFELLLKIIQYFNFNSINDSNRKSLYNKIQQSSRVQKLLQQQKKKKLWELAYMFSLKTQNLTQTKL